MAMINAATMNTLGEKLMDYLVRELHDDFVIFLNGQMWSRNEGDESSSHTTAAGTVCHVTADMPVELFIPAASSDTIAMMFDGSLYDEVNCADNPTRDEIQAILAPYGLRFDLIDPFTMVAREV